MVNSSSSETTTLISQISTPVSETQSFQILSEIFCKMPTRYTKLNLLFVRQRFLCYITKNIKFFKCLYHFVRFLYVFLAIRLFEFLRVLVEGLEALM
jgi:hypothetical protein